MFSVNPKLIPVQSWSSDHAMYKCTIRDLLQLGIRNWEYNRPPDMYRSVEIANHVYRNQKPVDWVFYCFQDKDNKINIVDGIHRYTALKHIADENQKTVDYITPSDFGHDGNATWLYDSYVFVSLRDQPSLGVTVDWYQDINKSHPVPELYMHSSPQEKRMIIENITKEWMSKYKPHFSNSLRPNQGNTNRELFVELLDTLYDKLEITAATQNKLYTMLDSLNNYARTNLPKKCTDKTLEKCVGSGCYLFLYKNDQLIPVQ
jgi:hypothetical protein